MVYVTSPCRTAWLYRFVYFPEQGIYDLIPEHRFIPSPMERETTWNEVHRRYIGAVVQPLCIRGFGDIQSNTENMDDSVNDSTRMGVRVVVVDRSGYGD